MNILIIASSLVGHELEYLHHYYDYAINDKSNNYVFLIPDDFDNYKGRYTWPESNNVDFDFISGNTLYGISKIKGRWSNFRMQFHRCVLLKKKCKEYSVDRIIANFFLDFFPLLPFFINKRIDFRGIIYKTPYKRKRSITKKAITNICYGLMSVIPLYKHIYILNEVEGCKCLNGKYGCYKFVGLPDPVPLIENYKDIRENLKIPESHKIFLQMGALNYRKRTVDILKAIKLIQDKSKMTFIFAGKIGNCKDEFYKLIEEIGNTANIIIIDKFCEDSLLNSLCYTCDCFLVPYLNCDQSSGCLAHAAYFNKFVIGPQEGLLGRLIRDYNLGMCLPPNASIEDMAEAISVADVKNTDTSDYTNFNSINNFQKIIMG